MRAMVSGDGSRTQGPVPSSERIVEELAELRAEHANLRAENARLAAKVDQLDAQSDAPEQGRAASGHRRGWRGPRSQVLEESAPVSRRRMCGLLGGAAAAGTGLAMAGSLLGASPAGADAGDVSIANGTGFAVNNDVAAATSMRSSVTTQTLIVANSSSTASSVWAAAPGGGTALLATANGANPAISASNTSGGNAIVVSAPDLVPQMNLLGGGAISGGPPASGNSGDLYVGPFNGSDAIPFFCVVGGSPGKWVRLSSVYTPRTPFRVYDSRPSQPNPSGATQAPLGFGAGSRLIDCSSAVPSGVRPAHVTAIVFNLAVVNTVAIGSLAMAGGTDPDPLTANINWFGSGQILSNAATSRCTGGASFMSVKVKCTSSAGASSDFILDVMGVYT